MLSLQGLLWASAYNHSTFSGVGRQPRSSGVARVGNALAASIGWGSAVSPGMWRESLQKPSHVFAGCRATGERPDHRWLLGFGSGRINDVPQRVPFTMTRHDCRRRRGRQFIWLIGRFVNHTGTVTHGDRLAPHVCEQWLLPDEPFVSPRQRSTTENLIHRCEGNITAAIAEELQKNCWVDEKRTHGDLP